VDERRRSLVMDDGVGVSAPGWWRRTAVDGVVDGGGWGGEGVLAPTEYEWGNGGREVGGTMSLGRACLRCRESYKLSPRLKFQTSERYWSVGDRTVISHTPNICRERFRPRRVCFGAHCWRPPCMNRGESRFRPRRDCVLAPTVYESG
jgi:hypothetical protein